MVWMTPKTYWIDEIMKNNYLALFEEIQINGAKGPMQLYAWYLGEQFIIEQSISELTMIQAEEDYEE
jgi:hypothetical protein